MATRVYIAISATSKNGDTVADDTGFTYTATFATLTLAWADATHGFKDLTGATGTDEEYFYDVFDSYTETTSGNANTAGFTLGAGNQVVVRAAPGFEHAGKAGTGVEITWLQEFQAKYRWANFVTVQDLSFIFLVGGSGANNFFINAGGTALRCLVKGGFADPGAINLSGNGAKAIACVAYDNNAAGIACNEFFAHEILGCTAINNGGAGITTGGSGGGSTQTIKNCLSIGNTGDDFAHDVGVNLDADTNASSDTTAQGTTTFHSLSTIEVVDVLNGDPHLSASTTVATSGTDLVLSGDITSLQNQDIDRQPFTGWPIGCDQPGEQLVPILITVKDNDTGSIVVGAAVYIETADLSQTHYAITDANGEVNYDMPFSIVQGISGRVRKGTTAPFYRTGTISGTLVGAGFTQTVFVTKDGEN